jgi:hypothetical protein
MYSVLMPYFPPLLLVALNRSISIFFPTTVPFSSTGMKFCCLVHKPHRYSYKNTDDSNLKASRLVSNTSIHYITKRLKQLHKNPCPILAESIDKDLTQGMLLSEKKCRSHGEDPWSLVLQQARLRVNIFRHALSMVRLGLENHHKIQRLLARYAIPVNFPDSLIDIQIALRMAQSSLRQVRKQATEE